MSSFNKDRRSSGGKGGKFGGHGHGGDRGSQGGFSGGGGNRPNMHKTTCSDCGNNCEVPFRPTGEKPVYCSDCFKKHRGGKSENFRGGKNRDARPNIGDKPSYQNNRDVNADLYKAQFEQLNIKIDKILRAVTPVVSDEADKTKAPKKKVDTKSIRELLKKSTGKKKVKSKIAPKKKTAAKKPVAKKKKKK